MNTTKRILGNYNVNTIDETNTIANEVTFDTIKVNIRGDLTVTGTVNSLNYNETEVTDLKVEDTTIILNNGETGSGISAITAGLEVDRGTLDDVGLRYNESVESTPGQGTWEVTNDGIIWYPILTSLTSSGLENVVEDLTPQLGGDLDVNGFTITSASNADVVIDANGTGQVKLDHVLSLEDQILTPVSTTGYNKIYAKIPGAGGSGIFVSNDEVTDELVSKTKAIIYSIIF